MTTALTARSVALVQAGVNDLALPPLPKQAIYSLMRYEWKPDWNAPEIREGGSFKFRVRGAHSLVCERARLAREGWVDERRLGVAPYWRWVGQVVEDSYLRRC